jgi:hypothetical protein
MADEEQPTKKVVKRVVKKTVVRPASAPAPKAVRYGRPVSSTSVKPRAKVATRPGPRPDTKPAARPAAPKISRPRSGAKVAAAGKALTSRGAHLASSVTGAAGSAGRATGTYVAARYDALRGWRIPHIDPRLAAGITGAFVGLVSVGLGLAALALFNELRGVSSGGGQWGSLTFVIVAFIAIVLGDLLLRAFGTAQAGLVSFLGAVLTIVAILALFLELADSQWALVLVPSLGAVTYLVAHWLITVAESSPTLPE